MYDVAIVGGGPAGYTAAEKAAQAGLRVILFEKESLGGVCLNEGCVPTKTLLYSAKLYDSMKSAGKYGITLGADASADLSKIISRKKKIVRKLTAGIKQKLVNHDVEIVLAEVKAIVKKDKESYIISYEASQCETKKIILCTGSTTFIPPIEGLDSIDYWTSKEALEAKELPQNLVIIGGGVIGIEFASFFNSLGVQVDVVEMVPEILGAMDKELSAQLREEYAKRGVRFHLKTKVVSVGATSVSVEENGEISEIQADKVLLSVGRVPNFGGMDISALNLETKGRGLSVNEYMQTSEPNIYACGDITGFSLLAHTAIRESEVAVNHILGKVDAMSYKAIPAVVYTNPEIAGVGETEDSLKAKNREYKVLSLPMTFSGRFVAENEMGNGTCKLLVNSDNVILGCHMLGNPASELIVIAGIAIEKAYTAEEFNKIVFPHPSVGEILHEVIGTSLS